MPKIKEAATEFLAHRRFAVTGSPATLADYGQQHGIEDIDGGCPLMVAPTLGAGHRAMRFVCTLTGHVPKQI